MPKNLSEQQTLEKNAEFKHSISKLFLKFNKFTLDLILLSEYLMTPPFHSVELEFKSFVQEELKKVGKKLDQNFKSAIDHLLERCKDYGRFPFMTKEKNLFEEEQGLLLQQFERLEKIKNYKTLDNNPTFLARLEDFCRILKPDGTFSIPQTIDLNEARDKYFMEEAINEEDSEKEEENDGYDDPYLAYQQKWGQDKEDDQMETYLQKDSHQSFHNAPWSKFDSDDEKDIYNQDYDKNGYMKKREEEASSIAIALPSSESHNFKSRNGEDEVRISKVINSFYYFLCLFPNILIQGDYIPESIDPFDSYSFKEQAVLRNEDFPTLPSRQNISLYSEQNDANIITSCYSNVLDVVVDLGPRESKKY